MKELLSLERQEDGEVLISVRQIHAILQVRTRFDKWFQRTTDTVGMFLGVHFWPKMAESLTEATGRPAKDYMTTLTGAKQLALASKGKAASEMRHFLIEEEIKYRKLKNLIGSPTTTAQALLQNINSLKEAVNLILQQEQRIAKLEEREAMRDDIRKEMLALPPAKEVAPVVDTRAYLNKWIRNYISANDITYSAAWGKFYKEFEMAVHIRLPKENRLDIIEERGLMEKAYAFAQKLFPEHP